MCAEPIYCMKCLARLKDGECQICAKNDPPADKSPLQNASPPGLVCIKCGGPHSNSHCTSKAGPSEAAYIPCEWCGEDHDILKCPHPQSTPSGKSIDPPLRKTCNEVGLSTEAVAAAVTMMSTATKADAGKPTVELLPFESLVEVGKVLQFGAKKYAAHNWRKGLAWSRLLGAALRHLFDWGRGQDNDPETGLSHLAHAACCVLFLLSYVTVGGGTDDRHVV